LARGLGFRAASVHQTVGGSSCPGRTPAGIGRRMIGGPHLLESGCIGGVPIWRGGLAGPGPLLGLGRLVPPAAFFVCSNHFPFLFLKQKAFV
jgi:hypothetical protein